MNHKNKTAVHIIQEALVVSPAFLLTLVYLLFTYFSEGMVSFSPQVILGPLVLAWIFLIPLFFFLRKITKERFRASFCLYLLALITYTSGEFFYVVFFSLILILLVWGGSYFMLRKKVITIRQSLATTMIAPTIIGLVTLFLLSNFFVIPDWKKYTAALPGNRPQKIALPETLPETMPDIYYIILDGYGREDVLRNYYGHDNSEFTKYLENKGFIIPSQARSNYAKTVPSVTSTLNMEYLHQVMDGVEDSVFWWLAKPYIQESLVQTSLEKMGYQTIALATGWDITNNSNANEYLKPRPIHLTTFEGNLIEQSLIRFTGKAISQLAYYPTHTSHRELLHYNFKMLAEIPPSPGPKFVFAHIVAPHPPFVFDDKGNSISPDYDFTFNDANNFPGSKEEYRTGYINQLIYINHLLEETIDAILSQSEISPIIILQADHGPGMLTDFSASGNTCLTERFSVLAAYHLPDIDPKTIPNDITPVNLFRIIFNEYFHTDLPLLKNASYYFKDKIYIYRTEDITQSLLQGDASACLIKNN